MSTDEVKDKLHKIAYALKCLENGSHSEIPSDFFESKVSKLKQLKEVYEKKLNLLSEEIKFAEEEIKVIAQEVGKAVGQAAREYGGEIDSAVATDFNDQSFTVNITYKNDNEESYQFYISDDTLFLLDRSYDREISDVGVTPSGEANVNKDVIQNEMQKYFKSMNEMDNIRPTDAQFNKAKEADRLAAHPEKDTIQAIYALMQREKEATTSNESGCNSHEQVNEDLNLHKIEVAVRDARRAQEIMYDQFDHQFEMNGSNVYLFDDPDTAFDAMMTLGSHDIEVLNIEDFDEDMLDEMEIHEMGKLKQVELQLKGCPIGCIATGGGYGPWAKVKSNTWKNKRGMLSNSQSLASHIGGFEDFKLDESHCNSTHEELNELFGNDMFDNRPHGETEFMGVKINKDKEDKEDKKPIKEFTSTGKLTNHDDFKFLAKQLTDLCGPKNAKDCVKILLSVGELGLDLGYAEAQGDAEMASAHKPVGENVDKVAGGIPYRVKGNKAIISEPLDDATKERLIGKAKEHGYHAAPNQAGGVTITLKHGMNEVNEDRFVAAAFEDLEQVIRNLAHTANISEDEALEMAINKLEAMLDGRDDLDEGRKDDDALYPDNTRLPEIKNLADKIVSMVKAEAAKGELGYIKTMEEIRYQQEDDFERTPEWNKAKGIRSDFDDYGSGTNESIASVSKQLDKVKADIKTELEIYKTSEGESAKKAAIETLKNLNDKKKNLEKQLDAKVAGTNRDQELDEKEEKPGLWANIRAKRARGEKPAHKNSNAHKDAVKAGKKINKEGDEKKSKTGKYGKHQVTVDMDGPVTTWKTTFPNGKSVAFSDTIANIKFDDGTTGADYLAETQDEVNEGDKEAQDAYNAVKDLIQKHARKLNDDDAYTFHELLKDFFNRAI